MSGLTRRATIAAGTALIAMPAVSAPAAAVPATGLLGSTDGVIKMESCLDGHSSIWSFNGIIYAVQPGQHPRAMLKVSGGDASWAIRQADGSWQVKGATMTFFRDPVTGAFLDTFENPFTGKRVAVRNNIVAGGGHVVHPVDGPPYFVGRARAGEIAGGFNLAHPNRPLGTSEWTMTDDTVILMGDQSFEVPLQPQMTVRTIFADRDAFLNPKVLRLPARSTATTFLPWLRWMEMGDTPGHTVWHCSSEKLFDASKLPADYRTRAGSLIDNLVTAPQG